MKILPDIVRESYVRLVNPVARACVALGISPNSITVIGTLFWIAGGLLYAAGEIRTGGFVLGVTALFDVLDGQVARLSGRETRFGAFLDSTLDRVADGAVLGGLAYFFATHPTAASPVMLAVCLAGIVGTGLVSYSKARAESVGVDVKVGLMQRPERVILLSAPQAIFALALNGMVLNAVVVFLTVSAWYTVAQRIAAVHRSLMGPAESASGADEPRVAPVHEPAAK